MCKWPELVRPCCKVAVTSRGLHAFHTTPPAFHADAAGPFRTITAPSPLCLGCPAWGVGLPAVSTMLSPTLYTSLPNYLVSWSAAATTLYLFSSLMTRSIDLSSPSVAMHWRAVSRSPLQSTTDQMFHDPRCQTGERFCPVLCAFIGLSLTRKSGRFSAGECVKDFAAVGEPCTLSAHQGPASTEPGLRVAWQTHVMRLSLLLATDRGAPLLLLADCDIFWGLRRPVCYVACAWHTTRAYSAGKCAKASVSRHYHLYMKLADYCGYWRLKS